MHALHLHRRLLFSGVAEAHFLETEKVVSKLRGGSLGCGARIVELVHQAGGEGTEGNQLFAVGGFGHVALQAMGHVGQDHLAYGHRAAPLDSRICLHRSATRLTVAVLQGRSQEVCQPDSITSPKESPALAMWTRVLEPSASALSAALRLRAEPRKRERLPAGSWNMTPAGILSRSASPRPQI